MVAELSRRAEVTTLHELVSRPLGELEAELSRHAARQSMSLLLCSGSGGAEQAALQEVVTSLRGIGYLAETVVALDAESSQDFRRSLAAASALTQRHRVIWCHSPRLREIDDRLSAAGLRVPVAGRQRAVWYGLGYILGTRRGQNVGLCDNSGISCHRTLLARLFYPLANPACAVDSCKVFQSRDSADRIERLLLAPLIHALMDVFGPSDYLKYLGSFHRPLSQELSIRRSCIPRLRIQDVEAFQLGLLSELQLGGRVCQTDLSGTAGTAVRPAGQGLATELDAAQVAAALLQFLSETGVVLDAATVQTVKATYQRAALDFVEAYRADNIANGLGFDTHREERAVEGFADSIYAAGNSLVEGHAGIQYLPSWNRVTAACPHILEHLVEAVELDHADYSGPAIFISCSRTPRGRLSASA